MWSKPLLRVRGLSNAMATQRLPGENRLFWRKADTVCFGLVGTKQYITIIP